MADGRMQKPDGARRASQPRLHGGRDRAAGWERRYVGRRGRGEVNDCVRHGRGVEHSYTTGWSER